MTRLRRRGFTLIELMIVVAIIGVLAAIAIPKFAELVRKSSEGNTKGNLAGLRSALNVYYADMEGSYPLQLTMVTVGGKFLSAIGPAKTPNYHTDSSVERDGALTTTNDTNGWLYDNVIGDANFGSLLVNCTHTDTKGTVWTYY